MAGDSDSLDSLSSPFSNSNKRLKVINSSNPEAKTINDPLESQEKEKFLESMEGSSYLNCGICLMEEGKSIRGQIDSCYHYFCFVCIMEWSKIESRCPMCKRRFTTIRRPRKEGVFPYERIVNVPQRDQMLWTIVYMIMVPTLYAFKSMTFLMIFQRMLWRMNAILRKPDGPDDMAKRMVHVQMDTDNLQS